MEEPQTSLLVPLAEDQAKVDYRLDFTDGDTAVVCSGKKPNGSPCGGVAEWIIRFGARKRYVCCHHFLAYCHLLSIEYGSVEVSRTGYPEGMVPYDRTENGNGHS